VDGEAAQGHMEDGEEEDGSRRGGVVRLMGSAGGSGNPRDRMGARTGRLGEALGAEGGPMRRRA
jgi:hypothetical protein